MADSIGIHHLSSYLKKVILRKRLLAKCMVEKTSTLCVIVYRYDFVFFFGACFLGFLCVIFCFYILEGFYHV